MKAGLYARVSTDTQLEGYSIDAQKEFLLNYAKSKEFTEYYYYVDGGYSGKDLNRPAIQRLIQDVKEHKIDTVIVFKLDRISRSQKDTLYLIEEVFNKYHVGFISMRENFDTTSPFGKAMIGILSVFAQLERETILERTRIGIKKRAELGFWRGGGKIPFPYRYDKEQGILIPVPEQVELLNKMISMYLHGKSFHKIGEAVGMDERQVEKRILSITNTGVVPYKNEIYEGQHEAVVSKELYEEILRVNQLRSKIKYARHYLLTGKVICGCCGAKYRYQKWGKRFVMYCNSRQKSKKRYVKDPNCKNKRWDVFEIETIVLSQLFSMKLDETFLKDTFDIVDVNVVQELKIQEQNIRKQIEHLINFISNGIAVEETSHKINVLEKKREDIQSKIKNSNLNKKAVVSKMEKSLSSVWKFMTFEEQRSVIEQLIDHIELDHNKVSIFYKIY